MILWRVRCGKKGLKYTDPHSDTKPAASRSETLSQAQQRVHTEQSKAKYTVQRYDSTSASLINFPFQSENDYFFLMHWNIYKSLVSETTQ